MLIGHYKLKKGVNVSVNGCVALYLGLWRTGELAIFQKNKTKL